MTDRSNDVEKLESIMEHLADSVLGLSGEAIIAEMAEIVGDPQEEAERIRLLLRQLSKKTEVVNDQQRTASQTPIG